MQFYGATAFVLLVAVVINEIECRTASRNRHRTRTEHEGGGTNTHDSHRLGSDSDLDGPSNQKRQVGDFGNFGDSGFGQNRPAGGGNEFGIGNNNQFNRPTGTRPQNQPFGGEEDIDQFNQNRPGDFNTNEGFEQQGFRPSGPQANRPNNQRKTTTTTAAPASTTACNCPPLGVYDPLCGTDNRTYSNEQALNCARRCGNSPGVTMAYKRACTDRPRT